MNSSLLYLAVTEYGKHGFASIEDFGLFTNHLGSVRELLPDELFTSGLVSQAGERLGVIYMVSTASQLI